MKNSHDIILIIIIGAIIIAQFYVFWGNYLKIRNYKKTIQNVKSFKIVEVSVPEEWIKDIEVDEILRDPAAFRKLAEEFDPNNLKSQSETKDNSQKNYKGEIEFPEDEGYQNNGSIEESEYYEESEEIEEEEEYVGPFKSIREKIKNILE